MKKFKITEEQIKENKDLTLKEYFKEVFETKLEVGKWYKHKSGDALVMICDPDDNKVKGYGFNSGYWFNDLNSSMFWGYMCEVDDWVLATKEEVEQALIKEAERRGFKEGAVFKSLINKCKIKIEYSDLCFDIEENILYCFILDISGVLFKDGVWAEIIEDKKEMTIEEIEKQLGYSIKIVKDETK